MDDDELRQALQRKADDVRPHREVPPALGRRAGRRILLNSLLVGTTAVVVVAGAIVGFRAFTGPATSGPGHGPTPPPAHSAPSSSGTPTPQTTTSGTPTCTGGELRANGSLEGAAGSREGTIDVTNFSDTTCTLEGRPHITLLTGPGQPITSGVTFLESDPGWKVDGDPRPAGWPVVTLHPGDTASVRIRWGNWCPQGRAAPLWQVDIPGGGPLAVSNGMEEPPPCNGEGAASTIEVGEFEPQRAP